MELGAAVSQFLSGYFSTCRRSTKTESAYRMDLAQFRVYFGDTTQVGSIVIENLEQWAEELKGRKYAPGSIRRKFASLRVFLMYCVRKGVLTASPLWKMRLDIGRDQRLPRSITAADAKRLLESAWTQAGSLAAPAKSSSDRRFLALRNLVALELLFATGMRVGELVTLSLPDWLEDEASLVIKGKGGRQRLAILPDERSKAVVSAYITRRKALNLGHNALLVNATGGQLTTQGVARNLARLAVSSGISVRLTPHMVRHTVATLLLRQGADIRVVQEVLGHASIAMTQRYTHVSKEHLRATLYAHHPNHHLGISWTIPVAG